MLYIGTSGFKFDDWKGEFYPPGIPQKEWLNFYATKFNSLEVNSTYYRLMHPAVFYHMARKTPEGFLFTVKAYRTMTHERAPSSSGDFDTFMESIQALIEAKKFGCILAQFPNSFKNTAENLDYITYFKEKTAGLPLVIEFRNRDWLTDEVFSWLAERGLGYCGVDEPQFKSLMPPIARVTSDIGYVRFHGRNYKDWWSGDKDRRYDYLYTEEELDDWLPKIREILQQSQHTFVFLNNCYKGKAAQNALQLKVLLEERPQD